jgi:hypothetical protein
MLGIIDQQDFDFHRKWPFSAPAKNGLSCDFANGNTRPPEEVLRTSTAVCRPCKTNLTINATDFKTVMKTQRGATLGDIHVPILFQNHLAADRMPRGGALSFGPGG